MTPKTLQHLGELRAAGWLVGSHNDYVRDDTGEVWVYWCFTHNDWGRFVDANGRTDDEAIWNCLMAARGVKCR